jgi:hypothetical protein
VLAPEQGSSPEPKERQEPPGRLGPSRKVRREAPKTQTSGKPSPCRSRNPREPCAYRTGNRSVREQTRPVAQGPEVEERKRAHLQEPIDGRETIEARSSAEILGFMLAGETTGGQVLPERDREGGGRRGTKLRRVLAPWRFVRHAPQGTRRRATNTANPRIGSGVQQTRKVFRGENHQDGEKP